MTADDAGKVVEWLNRASVCRYLSSNLRGGNMTPALVRAALRRRDQMWMVFCAEGDEAIGLVALDSIDPVDGVANIWYLLGEEAWARRGLTRRALDLFAKENPLNLATVTAWVGEPNLRSINCLRGAGFREVGRITGGFLVEGRRYDRIIFERVLRHD